MLIIFRSYFGLQQADLRPIICRSYFDLISGYSRPILGRSYADLIPILFRITAGQSYFRSRRNSCVTAGKTHHGCRKNKLRLLWNALLATPYVIEHYKYMFLVARDMYEMLVVYRGKHTTRRSTVGVWSEVRVYRTPATNISWAGVLRLCSFPDKRRLKCRKINFFDVLDKYEFWRANVWNHFLWVQFWCFYTP